MWCSVVVKYNKWNMDVWDGSPWSINEILKCETDWGECKCGSRWPKMLSIAWSHRKNSCLWKIAWCFRSSEHRFQMLLPFQVGLWSILAMAQTFPRRSTWIQHQTHMDTPNMSYPDAFLKAMNVNLVRSWSSSFRMLLAIQQVQKQLVIGQYLHIIQQLQSTQHSHTTLAHNMSIQHAMKICGSCLLSVWLLLEIVGL